jgi:hypothetical protein
MLLDGAHLVGEGGLGKMHAPRRLGKVPGFGKRDERFEVADFKHGREFIINRMNDESKNVEFCE